MKALYKQLFKTFIFSVIISIAASCIYYAVMLKGRDIDYNHVLPKMVEGIIFLNIIIFMMTLPTLFLANISFYNNLPVRLALYFSGSVIYIITTLCLGLNEQYKMVYLLTGVIFIIVHAVFYFRMVKSKA